MPDRLDHGQGRDGRYYDTRRRFDPRDDVPEERQTHERVDIPDPGTTYRPLHERREGEPGELSHRTPFDQGPEIAPDTEGGEE